MSTYLDPANRAFVDSLKGPHLYEKSSADVRQVLENIQNYKPASNVAQETVNVEVNGKPVKTVIFRPVSAQSMLEMIFHTHGGGWILGRRAAVLFFMAFQRRLV
jgi:acetyl esterase